MGIRRANRGVVVALPDSTLKAMLIERLRQRGWHVWRASSSCELRRLTAEHFPVAVVLAAEGRDESGWLTCAKLLRAQPRLRVILIGYDDPDSECLAGFVGAAALISPEIDPSDLIAEIEGTAILVG
jgi:DNA-binding response OmpR family regulator